MSTEGWLIFRGKLVADPSVIENVDPTDAESLQGVVDSLQEAVEVVKGEMISKSYIKLKESPLFHPNVSYGDIMQVKPCDSSLSEKVTILEFNGVEHTEFDPADFEDDVRDLGTASPQISPHFVGMMKGFDSKVRPIINNKFEQGLVFEPTKFVSHGSYKINVAYEASDDELNEMKEYFNSRKIYFQPSSAKSLGSVAFGLDVKFKDAVKYLEGARWVKHCYLAFNPNDFPQIEFSPDLIPNSEEDFE